MEFFQFEPNDEKRVSEMRIWVVEHYDNEDDYSTVSGKLKVIQAILDNKWIEPNETWKLQSLEIAFGDALEQEVSELHWAMIEDEYGRDPALRWLETSVGLFPMTSISKRIEDGITVDVYDLFGGYQKAMYSALESAD